MGNILSSWFGLPRGGRNGARGAAVPRRGRPALEVLEDRTALSVTVPAFGSPGPVVMTGTDGPDQFVIRLSPLRIAGVNLQFSDDGGATFQMARAQDITQVFVNGLGGDDTLTLDSSNGLVGRPSIYGPLPIEYDGGDGFNQLVLTGDPGAPVAKGYSAGPGSDEGMATLDDGSLSSATHFVRVQAVIDDMPGPSPFPAPTGSGGQQANSPGSNPAPADKQAAPAASASPSAAAPAKGAPAPAPGDAWDSPAWASGGF